MISGQSIPSGKTGGYYFAEDGSVKWRDLYEGIASRLAQTNVIEDSTVRDPSPEELLKLAGVLNCPPPLLQLQMGGR